MRRNNRRALIFVYLLALLLVSLLLQNSPTPAAPLQWVIRVSALIGYACICGAILTSAFLRHMRRWFGRPFMQVHHILSVTGLVLVTLHPLAVAWQAGSLGVFVPAVGSWYAFFSLGGRPAWYLLAIGALAALFRAAIGPRWRLLHILNYVAFWLATVHGLLIGSSVQSLVMQVVFGAMALVVLWVLIRKRAPLVRRCT